MANQERINSDIKIKLTAPCEQTSSKVTIVTPQEIRFHLGDATCDSCEVNLIGEKEGVINIRVKFSEITYNGRCVRPLDHNQVIVE
jgi:hypothetical protein